MEGFHGRTLLFTLTSIFGINPLYASILEELCRGEFQTRLYREQPQPMEGNILYVLIKKEPLSLFERGSLIVTVLYLLLADEEWAKHQRDGGKELHQYMQRRAGCVLERVANRVADYCGGMGWSLFPKDIALFVLEQTALDVLLGVIPCAATVVHVAGHQDTANGAYHEESAYYFWGDACVNVYKAEEHTDDDRRKHYQEARCDHLAQAGLRGDIHTVPVVWLGCAGHNAWILAELAANLFDYAGCGFAYCSDSHCAEEVNKHCAQERANEYLNLREVDCVDLAEFITLE